MCLSQAWRLQIIDKPPPQAELNLYLNLMVSYVHAHQFLSKVWQRKMKSINNPSKFNIIITEGTLTSHPHRFLDTMYHLSGF